MIDTQTDAKAIFLDALDCTSADEISRFLDKACGTDTGLRRRVEKLLRAHREAGAFLGGATGSDTPCDQPNTLSPGTRIGPYLLREQIGEGGMGLVFVADQEQPVRRRVALKVVKPGMDTRQVLARFEAERQALALMDHPNIAKVLDASTTSSPLSPPGRGAGGEGILNQSSSEGLKQDYLQEEPLTLALSPGGRGNQNTGRPYFVMELVRGVPITEYCDQARLNPRQRLELFLPVCRAIQHAHQKGVIHRDIKPSNLLVTLYDSHPVPKVIDFGIAKAVGPGFADHSVYTGFAQLVGTPMYMSPEQAEMTAQDVDTRADVYALGVVLYELLTGTTPFDAETLRRAGFDEMRRIIREDEPVKPSQRVTTLSAEKQTTVTGQRGVDGRQLGRQLRGGLDWVVMTCLAKDRTRRYESTGALAADIERYLRDEAVEACPPSTSYRVRTFARRRRRMLATVGVIAVALVTATAVSVWQAVAARSAQHRAETAESRATTDAAIARAVNDFLQMDLLGKVDSVPEFGEEVYGNRNLTVREALDRAAAKIDSHFQDQPLVEAAIRMVIGEAYGRLQAHQKSIAHLERAYSLNLANVGPVHPDTLASMSTLAEAYSWMGRHSDAIALSQLVLAHQNTRLGPDDPKTLQCVRALADANFMAGQRNTSVRLLEPLVEKLRIIDGPTHHDTIGTMRALALTYETLDRLPEALALYESTLELMKTTTAPENQIFFKLCYAYACQRAGMYDQAENLLREALDHNQKRDDSLTRRISMANIHGWLARTLLLQNRYVEAEPLVREAVAIFEKELPDNQRRFYWVSLLGGILFAQQKYTDAEPLLLLGYEGMKSRETVHVETENPRLAETGNRIVRFYEVTNQPKKARAWREKLELLHLKEHTP